MKLIEEVFYIISLLQTLHLTLRLIMSKIILGLLYDFFILVFTSVEKYELLFCKKNIILIFVVVCVCFLLFHILLSIII